MSSCQDALFLPCDKCGHRPCSCHFIICPDCGRAYSGEAWKTCPYAPCSTKLHDSYTIAVYGNCDLPPADEAQLEEDMLLFGTAFKQKCQKCGKYHRLAPETVVLTKRKEP